MADRDLIPTVGLASLAGILSWRANYSHPIPLKILACCGGVLVSSLATHRRFRDFLTNRAAESIPERVKIYSAIVDAKVGEFGSRAWVGCCDAYGSINEKLINALK